MEPTVPAGGAPPASFTLAYDPPSVSGGAFTRGDVQRIALQRRARLRRCYADALATEPTLAGEVVVAFRIAPDGHVQSAARDESTLARPPVEHCFVRAIRTWRFPAHDDATTPTSVRLRIRLSLG